MADLLKDESVVWDDGKVSDEDHVVWDTSPPPVIDQALSRSAILSHNTDPAKQAENNQKMVDLGMPKSFASPATHNASTDEIKQTVDKFTSLSGYTAQYIADPEFAKIAKDDLENLSIWEDGIVPVLFVTFLKTPSK